MLQSAVFAPGADPAPVPPYYESSKRAAARGKATPMKMHLLLIGLLLSVATGCAASAAGSAARAGAGRPTLGIAAWAPPAYPGLALAIEEIAVTRLRSRGEFDVRHARVIEDSWREACGGVDNVMELRIRSIDLKSHTLSITASLYDCSTDAMCWQVLGTSGKGESDDASVAAKTYGEHMSPAARSWAPAAFAAVSDVLAGAPESDAQLEPGTVARSQRPLSPPETASAQSRSVPPAAPSSAP